MKAMKAKKAVKAMKAMKAMTARKAGAPLTKGGMSELLASESGLKKVECSKILDAIADMGADQVKGVGKFVIPGLCTIKTKKKPATKAGMRMMFGKEVKVAAKPAKTVVKAFCNAKIKKAV